ncbi:MAG: Rrf2 family transcriptional regulator [Treponema sp.]|nr:Rrf2 family transcriptional regulator [Treponema sp.]
MAKFKPSILNVPLKLLSHRRNLSVKYLEQILIQLAKANLVTGLRGINGGYKLVKPASEYTAGEILRAMEGDLTCISVTENNTVKTLGNETFWKDLDKTINDYVNSVTLDQIVKKNAEGSNFNYCI